MLYHDAIIIGTGQAGPALARRLVAAGWKVAIIERKLFGGTCVNTGCTPTKTLVAGAYAAHVTQLLDIMVGKKTSIHPSERDEFASAGLEAGWALRCSA